MTTATIEKLRDKVQGRVILEGDSDYEDARHVYNGMIDRHPAAVVRTKNSADVAACVNFARDSGLDLSVRGGAHSVPGFGTNDGGLVIDMADMKAVRVDPRAQTVRAEGGCLWGDFNEATYEHGLATTGGIIASTGIAGLTLGGGIGYLTRAYGLSLDNLISCDVVTADGRTLKASERENEDLFWALRGGGGNYGAVTTFEYRLHPVKDIVAGIFFYSLDHTKTVLEFYRDYIDSAPEQMGCFPAFQIAPPLPFIQEKDHGDTFIIMVACWSGDAARADEVMQPFRDVAPRTAEMVELMPYPALNGMFDPLLPPGLQHYWKASFATELTDGAIAAHLEHGPKVPVVNSTMHIYPINGAAQRVAPNATAFAYREAKFATVIAGMWPDPADNEKNVRWVKDYYSALEPHSLKGGYINFMADDDQGRIRDNYRGNYDRLVAIKRQYDPTNLFHMNQNIKP